jgi:MYXO-CTERM domain-containing protein
MRRTIIALLLIAAPAQAQFSYSAPGTLERSGGGALRPGAGRVDDNVYAPGIRFPIEVAPAYLNSQIYGHGGYMGPGGGQCDAANYAYPWHDNYCEERSWDMPMCPSGQGHQGQDIRPSTCADNTHYVVAADAGTITNIGSYSVYLTADDGRRYDYLHMRSVSVSVGQRVSRGQRLGRVSNNFGGTPTSIHLHFNIRMNVSGYGSVYAPTYMSLIRSYEELAGPVPWSAAYVSQSFPLASRPFELTPGQEVDGYLEMRNIGGSTWQPGQTFLGTTGPRDVACPFAHESWIGPNRPATVDRAVPPGETGRFNFRIRGPSAPGDYPQYFNLVQEGVAWFSDTGLPPDDQLQIRVTVIAPPPCTGSADWMCEGTERVRCNAGVLERESCAMGCESGVCTVPVTDEDADGFDASTDCDDSNAAIHPGASETCGDTIDQDCDGADAACDVDASVPLPDAGADPSTTLSGGCNCRTAPGRSSWPLASFALLALVWLRRALRNS